jgi:His-Xaa-Ser system protein HxsD
MTTSLEGLPGDRVHADLGEGAVTLVVDATLYPTQALYGAAYTFIDRCFVLLDRADDARFRVTLSPKKPGADAAALRALVGEFSNELLSCAWRHQITQENRAIIEAVTTQALSGAMGPPSLDELASFDFTEETFEDPLGIAMSWEEKYKKPKAEEAGTGTGAGAGTAVDAAGAAGAAVDTAGSSAAAAGAVVAGEEKAP